VHRILFRFFPNTNTRRAFPPASDEFCYFSFFITSRSAPPPRHGNFFFFSFFVFFPPRHSVISTNLSPLFLFVRIFVPPLVGGLVFFSGARSGPLRSLVPRRRPLFPRSPGGPSVQNSLSASQVPGRFQREPPKEPPPPPPGCCFWMLEEPFHPFFP